MPGRESIAALKFGLLMEDDQDEPFLLRMMSRTHMHNNRDQVSVEADRNSAGIVSFSFIPGLLKESPPIGESEQSALDKNHVTVARRGREPGLTLWREGQDVPMADWARELLDSMVGLCEILDRGDPTRPYSSALATQAAKLDDVARTPSARLMEELTTTGESFFDLALRMSATHKAYFLDLYAPNGDRLVEFGREAEESLAKQRQIEASDSGTFEEYLSRYFAN